MKTSQESSVIYKRNPFAEHWHQSQLVMIYQRQVSTLSLTTPGHPFRRHVAKFFKNSIFQLHPSLFHFFTPLYHSFPPSPLPPLSLFSSFSLSTPSFIYTFSKHTKFYFKSQSIVHCFLPHAANLFHFFFESIQITSTNDILQI